MQRKRRKDIKLNINPLETDEISAFLSKHGKAGIKILAGLGEIYPELLAVFSTEVGKEILKEDIGRLEALFPLIYTEKASPLELAEYRYIRDIRIPRLIGKLYSYLTKSGMIRGQKRLLKP